MMALRRAAGLLVTLVIAASAAQARDFTLEEVGAVAAYDVGRIKPSVIIFNDQSETQEGSAGSAPGLVPFDQWSRTRPDQKRLLTPYPDYPEPATGGTSGRAAQNSTEKLTMYVAEARFLLDRVPALTDLARYTSLSFVERVDPAIQHRIIAPTDIAPVVNPKAAHNRNPGRPWCVGTAAICLRSHYRLEGKLPLGIQLANKVRDAKKKIADHLEFESELAVRAPEELDQAPLMRLTGIETPIIGALEQTTFYVNQILQFGKSIVVFQHHPSLTNKTVVTSFIAVAIESNLLNTRKEYARVPVLRNLVPVQVLMGKSSFNTGTSISAGLPNYTRSRIRAMARIFDGE